MKVYFVCGRMNPPTLGHLKLVQEAAEEAQGNGADCAVFVTRTRDCERNPLAVADKLRFVEASLGVRARDTMSPFTALEELFAEGYREMTFVAGDDRVGDFTGLVHYGAKIGAQVALHGVSRDEAEPSATKARDAVARGDLIEFSNLVPGGPVLVREMFQAVELGMKEN